MARENKAEIYEQFDEETPGQTQQSFSFREKLALACKILGANGHGENIAGQITIRSDEKPGCFLTPCMGPAFNQVRDEDICLIDRGLGKRFYR